MKDQYNELCAAVQNSRNRIATTVERPLNAAQNPAASAARPITKADIAKAVAKARSIRNANGLAK